MFKIDHMVFFSVPHKTGVVFQLKNIWKPQQFGKSRKDDANLGQIEKL